MEPVFPAHHVIVTLFGLGNALINALCAIGHVAVFCIGRPVAIRIPDVHELGYVGPLSCPRCRSTERGLRVELAISCGHARTPVELVFSAVGHRVEAVDGLCQLRRPATSIESVKRLIAKQRELIDFRHLIGQFVGAGCWRGWHRDGLRVRSFEIVSRASSRCLPLTPYRRLARRFMDLLNLIHPIDRTCTIISGNGHPCREGRHKAGVDAGAEGIEMVPQQHGARCKIVIEPLGEAHSEVG